MKTSKQVNMHLTQDEIDQLVVAEADNESAWDAPIFVQPTPPNAVALPAELAARAAFMARLHRSDSVEEWLLHIIQERLDMEEAMYGEIKRDAMLTFAKHPPKHRLKTAAR